MRCRALSPRPQRAPKARAGRGHSGRVRAVTHRRLLPPRGGLRRFRSHSSCRPESLKRRFPECPRYTPESPRRPRRRYRRRIGHHRTPCLRDHGQWRLLPVGFRPAQSGLHPEIDIDPSVSFAPSHTPIQDDADDNVDVLTEFRNCSFDRSVILRLGNSEDWIIWNRQVLSVDLDESPVAFQESQ